MMLCNICVAILMQYACAYGQGVDGMSDELLPQVAKLRDLPFLQTFEKTFQTPEELQQVLLAEIERTYPGDTLQRLEKRLLKFGFVVRPIDLRQMFMRMLSQEIAGYYDPIKKKMVLIANSSGNGGPKTIQPMELVSRLLAQSMGVSLDNVLLAHELTHALQDQHFNLRSLPFESLDPEDTASAAKALVEGDAMLVMMDYMLAQQGEGLDSTTVPDLSASLHVWSNNPLIRGFNIFQSVPRYLMDNLLFSYLDGFDFVLYAKKRGGWQAVNQMYRDYPVSTEQILHPEKFFEHRDQPVKIQLPKLPEALSAWRILEENTLGEFNIKILIDGFMSSEQARIGSEGWGGDRFMLCEQPETKQLFLIWHTAWDTRKDAEEFFRIYAGLLEKRYMKSGTPTALPKNTGNISNPSQKILRTAAGNIVIEIRGSDVLMLDGVPGSLQHDTLQRLWRKE